MPDLMAIYHIKPWHLDEMTNDEIAAMLKDLLRRKEAAAEADDSDGSGRARRRAASRRKRR